MASEKCFAKGSSAPGLVAKGQIRLYSMRFCPFAHRTRLVLHAKGIKHDTVNINLKDKPEWFLKKNPLGLVPTLETSSGQVIYESPITCDYLDEVYTDKKLLPADPFQKAQQKMMLENFSKDLVNKKSKFFGGNAITMIDYMMWPWFERLEIFELKHCLDGTPELKKWTEHMSEDQTVKATMFPTETYKAFYKTYADGKPNYDYGL
ncbi:glutathione S-transferase omega-1 isoform X1 [Oncorhynchus mykiss]|uniref:glutathione S-transferase omega-1 isoform X1 n=1 Tax=Oncorhynchus mykiss TaxID=8022 RepID=UPI001878E95C|nr:glutathione S-transferase omega-1 isoform X1 [Oncorhynchus mykiss]